MDVMGNFYQEELQMYVESLYMKENATNMGEVEGCILAQTFDAEIIAKSLKKMGSGKAPGTLHICLEMLKWAGPTAQKWLHDLLNQAVAHGIPCDWQENWIKALYKGGDRNQPSNYRTIMIGACMNKLLGSMVEQEMSKWAENNNKRAIGQAGFRPKHSTIDHLITLRVITKKCRLKGQIMYCCFVDFQKAFDTIPRANLWARMERLRVPTYLRRAVAHMYREVRCKIKTQEGYSREFMSNMGVKQGCPLSPTLFGLCIDQLEEVITQCMKEEKMMNAVSDFCKTSGLAVNVTKTKVMVIKTHHTGNQPIIMYNGRELEVMDRSRLGCQVLAKPELDGVRLAIPSATRNFAVDGYVPKPH
ncbi:hypothetical protein L7F22_044469 [Adiantum nelumboides]|nr:hypothetical protein [Adiantum nelumboides]